MMEPRKTKTTAYIYDKRGRKYSKNRRVIYLDTTYQGKLKDGEVVERINRKWTIIR